MPRKSKFINAQDKQEAHNVDMLQRQQDARAEVFKLLGGRCSVCNTCEVEVLEVISELSAVQKGSWISRLKDIKVAAQFFKLICANCNAKQKYNAALQDLAKRKAALQSAAGTTTVEHKQTDPTPGLEDWQIKEALAKAAREMKQRQQEEAAAHMKREMERRNPAGTQGAVNSTNPLDMYTQTVPIPSK